MTTVFFCNNNYYDNSYINVVDFETSQSRDNFFSGLVLYTKECNLKADDCQTELTVLLQVEQLGNADYLYFKNKYGKSFFYFILNKFKKTDNSTVLEIELDVWQTYQFDIIFLPSYVERCHVDRWENDGTPTKNILDEGIEFGESVPIEIKKLADMNNSYVICSSTPLGVLTGGTGGDEDIGTDIENKIVESARKLIGKPYVWGGNYPPLGNDRGTDCSGLCQWAYNDNGKKITRTTYTQIKEGKEVTLSDVKKADLIFTNFTNSETPEHVYLFSGKDGSNYMVVEAPEPGKTIRERAMGQDEINNCRVRRLL